MSKSSSTQSLADSTMALLGKAMDRNSRLAAPPPALSPTQAPTHAVQASTPIVPQPTAVVVRPRPIAAMRRVVRTSGLRFTPQDHERINRIINQALSMGERIPMSDAVRLALIAYDPRKLTTSDLAVLQATDGRMRQRSADQR